MNKKRYFLVFSVLLLLCAFFIPKSAVAQDASAISESKTEINFFYSAICPHCKAEEAFLGTLNAKYPEVKINRYEVIYNAENQKLLKNFYDKYDVPNNERGLVPATFTSTKYFVGFNDQTANEIENCLKECLGRTTTPANTVKLPFFGEVDFSKISLPAITVILGTLDGFNPCAMWILVVLLSMLVTSKSRKKIALVGGVFIFAEGLLYFLIMSAWLNVFFALSFAVLIRIAIGLFGIGFGIWRIRDFFIWKPGVCKVVDESKSKSIMDRINNILKPSTLPATIFGIIALAFGVNIIEFFCSAGFPTIYTRILALQNLSLFQYYLYLFFYIIFYMLDDIIVFVVAFLTLNRLNFSEKYSRYSTLVAGALLLILGIMLIVRPEILMFAQ